MSVPGWDLDGGADDPVLLPAADLGHDGPRAHQLRLLIVVIFIPLLDADPAGAVRPLNPHRVRAGAAEL